MKVVILASGFDIRITEESYLRSKPIIEIDGQPIPWHIMKCYSSYGFHDSVIYLGYRRYVVKEYFADYFLHTSDVTFNLSNSGTEVLRRHAEPWKATLIDTGLHTMTGGRVRRIHDYVGNEPFLLTYGDGVSDADLSAPLAFHQKKRRIATITIVNIGQAKDVLDVGDNEGIRSLRGKDDSDNMVINGGFMAYEPDIFDYITGDDTALKQEPFRNLCRGQEFVDYYHRSFWRCMDTQCEKKKLEELWESSNAPWKW